VLHVHRAARADHLADALAALLREPPDDPFVPDVVAVTTRGMERWLSQRLSATLGASPARADGVCANVLFPSPHRLLTDAVAVASGIEPDRDPWRPERALWPLLEVVERSLHEPWLAPLAGFLGASQPEQDAVRRSRRLTVVRHLARLFDRYALYRPDMLAGWSRGSDPDGAGWQAELWRRLRAAIDAPEPAARRAGACARIREEPSLLALPGRLALFGLTRLPAGHLEMLRALATGREVHLLLLHPSPALWRAVAELIGDAAPATRRADDTTGRAAANPLLASWARDAREMQLVLAGGGGDRTAERAVDHDDDPPDLPGGERAPRLLERIQDDVRHDRRPPGASRAALAGASDPRPPIDAGDESLQIHSCHGRVRQVEVLRDAIRHALVRDDTLEPRDVIVMCPDIETFAPLIEATFGAGETLTDDGPGETDPDPLEQGDLRVRLADRSPRQTNPLLAVVSVLLELAPGRLTASEVLDLADREPVRRRFRFDDDDLNRLRDWIAQAGIRWGLDAAHRAPFGLERLDHGTWRRGVDRLLLGVTMTEEGGGLFAGTLPLDDVDSRSIDLAGRLAELIERLGDAVDALSAAQPLADWARAIADAVDALTATAERDRWQRAQLAHELDEMVAEASGPGTANPAATGSAPPGPPLLAPAELRAHLAARLEGRSTRANFRTGHLTVCTLMPMRSVPHRVVCLLGLDDGAFPRRAPRDGDDLMLDDPRVGERDPRSEDRQLLLDALMAATERLIVTYTGNDERTNIARPPAVPVAELLDLVDQTARAADGGPAQEHVVIRHPLHPFDPRNFAAGALAGAGPWSFDDVTLAGARALTAPRTPPAPFLDGPLPPQPARPIELDDLVRFLEHPVRAFLRARLGISPRGGVDELQDGMPVELDALERWGVGQRLLEARLRGVDGRTACLAEIARGTLPPGVLGEPVITRVYPIVDAIVAQAQALAGAGAATGGEPVDIRVPLGGGRLLTGTVSGVSGDVLLTTTYSRVSPRHRLAAWARLLALSATRPDTPFTAITVGRASGEDDVRIARIPPLDGDPARRAAIAGDQLALLVELHDRGMREPLPIYCLTSAAYAAAALAGRDPVEAARGAWETEYLYEREDREPEHRLALGGVRTLAELIAQPPAEDERGDGWPAAQTSRLGRYAVRLWEGLLAREEIGSR
jgi:exodeoxyribonuclease V gamma subunit